VARFQEFQNHNAINYEEVVDSHICTHQQQQASIRAYHPCRTGCFLYSSMHFQFSIRSFGLTDHATNNGVMILHVDQQQVSYYSIMSAPTDISFTHIVCSKQISRAHTSPTTYSRSSAVNLARVCCLKTSDLFSTISRDQ